MLRCFILCLTILFQIPDVFNAKVIKITDGDTIVVLTTDNQQIKIRLEGIDCPEMKQDFGNKAKQATSDLCYGERVSIHKSGTDRYGRTLAYVYVGDKCINKELLKLGMAWHFKKYNSPVFRTFLLHPHKPLKINIYFENLGVAKCIHLIMNNILFAAAIPQYLSCVKSFRIAYFKKNLSDREIFKLLGT